MFWLIWFILGGLSGLLILYVGSVVDDNPEIFKLSPVSIVVVSVGVLLGLLAVIMAVIFCIGSLIEHKPFLKWFLRPFNENGGDS